MRKKVAPNEFIVFESQPHGLFMIDASVNPALLTITRRS